MCAFFQHVVQKYILEPQGDRAGFACLRSLSHGLAVKMGAKADHIFVKSEYKLVRINLADILYIESLRDYIAIHTSDKQKL